ncbi:MAG: hypothetical protein FWF02_14070 [Micrococcales bacterium]|nr:hypothetical protein [Micrococcales bacterium]MCL2668803.1 hypothetical protein [Micrococcales bacterium]
MPIRPRAARPEPPSLPAVFFAQHHPRWVAARRVRDGTWVRLGRGVYGPSDLGPEQQALAHLVAVHHRTAGLHWFSHQSAALLFGLPLREVAAHVHLRQPGRPSTNRDMSVVRHFSPVDPAEQATVSGLPVTSMALTTADCLRALPPLDALIVADGALRAGADPVRIDSFLAAGRGSVPGRAVASLADPGAESVAETTARFHLLAAGLPVPQTQVLVHTNHGVYWGDLGYTQWKVLIEYDGQDKYTDTNAFLRERERQDAIEAQGWRIVRLTYKDLRHPARLVRRVSDALPPGIALSPRPHLGSHSLSA